MRHRDLSILLTQGDKEYTEANWNQFSAVISLNEEGASVGCGYLHRPVKDEDTPSPADIACWVSFALQFMGDNKRVLVNCQAGQNRSLTIGTLILSFFENRPYVDVVKEIHDKCLQEDPPHNWGPYQHWADAIDLWHRIQVEQKPLEHKSLATHPGIIPLEEALKFAGGQRPDYLTSLYKYTLIVPDGGRIVELGCYKGDSTVMIACGAKGRDIQIITVDPVFQHGGSFVPDAHLKYPGFHASSLVRFLNRLSEAGLDGMVSVVPDYSWNLLKRWDSRKIDLLFVDAEHSHEGAKRDAEWMQHVRVGGWAAWDDWISAVSSAVLEHIADKPYWKLLHQSTDTPTSDYCITILQRT